MPQKPFYLAETFDLAITTVTFTAAGLGSAKYTVGVCYLARLDASMPSLNGYISALFSPGSGTAGTVYFGCYAAVPGSSGESNSTLYLLGSTANQGGASAGVVRVSFGVTDLAFPAQGNLLGGNPVGTLYGALLVRTDAGTNHVDCATSTPFAATDQAVELDPTGYGGYPRALTAGTSLTALAETISMSSASGSSLMPWFAID
jgi:hypothetical protein